MSKTEKQIDLEETIIEHARATERQLYPELTDPFLGLIFRPKARNHYEHNDGIPVAPQVELNRPTIRQRIENLINRDPAVLQRYMQEGPPDGSEGVDMDVPDDPDAPITASEGNYLDSIAEELAEHAPLPDEGLPRPDAPKPSEVPQTAPAAPGGGPGAVQAAPAAAPPAPAGSTVPTR